MSGTGGQQLPADGHQLPPGGLPLPAGVQSLPASYWRVPAEGLLRPPALRAGSRVRIVALSGPVVRQRLERGSELLRSLGLEVSWGDHVLDKGPLDHLAGADADRAADLQTAWVDPAVDAVWAARGGYGATRVLDLLDWDALADATASSPPVFVGSSDLTAVLMACATRLGLVTFHGPTAGSQLLAGAAPEPASLDGLRHALFAPTQPLTLSGGVPLSGGAATGITLGGNLSMLATLVGTPEGGRAAGAIVLLEDVNEQPYEIDRMLTQLLRSGWFEGVAGIACGTWHDCGAPDQVVAVLRDRLGPLGVPLVTELPYGHGPVQLTIPVGVPAVLDAGAGTLHCPSDADTLRHPEGGAVA